MLSNQLSNHFARGFVNLVMNIIGFCFLFLKEIEIGLINKQ